MILPQFWRRSLRKVRRHLKVTQTTEPVLEKTQTKTSEYSEFERPQTARNALKLALETLRSISATIPMGSALSGVIDSFLAVTNRIEQRSANTYGFIQVAARIERIVGILSDTPNQGLIDDLHEELQSITADLKAASSLGKLDQFFNSTQNAACITKHNERLTQIICTASTINTFEILKSIQALELKTKYANDGAPFFYIKDTRLIPFQLNHISLEDLAVREGQAASAVKEAEAKDHKSSVIHIRCFAIYLAEQAASAGLD
ncbi:hypothetical protein B0H19DRAFT_1261240 [Mycena capillaripes]|nr:hypothetical protein B0H19DRAFT_1261240 [Mycena capillaripes]